jgi:hypothetical protein
MSERSERARLIIEDDLFSEAFDAIRQGYTDALINCAPGDDMGRYRLTEALRMVSAVREHLEAVLKTGEMESINVTQFEGRQRLIRRF